MRSGMGKQGIQTASMLKLDKAKTAKFASN